ncbi:hypothetical protein CAOG_03687 [Capsaspora owczarzaki ATCC 30864]|uniref:NAD-dependent epimerase/dehydratase domain-containing protein n=1 Tax=Capsaspora owczarzaki (strain ATCC 30864) TaxID=595528 RepID=A0A0D2WPU3_CAPO3|nr:hypothetical protein CAOG_03687 [Capsaspora owczarzaki ATCC 30864]KJE92788.1 hypothetical protein CAOG_003687 [Capsaspora owczarzaki ATCC 30864]|eukprot:XP_004363415.1 hypothetical protein CAOG_03687 [Capsaspora owczarzaki ATCC 30864]
MVKVFVTGATGLIGGSVARQLRRAGHVVYGLVRTEEKARVLAQDDIIPVIGQLAGLAAHSALIATCAAVIHAAFDGESFLETDALVIHTVLNAPFASGQKPLFVYTSGCLMIPNRDEHSGYVDDFTTPLPHSSQAYRLKNEQVVTSATTVHGVVLRPGFVFGKGAAHFERWFAQFHKNVPEVVIPAAERQYSYIHADDLAEAYQRVVENPKIASGSVYTIGDDSRITHIEFARVFAKAAGYQGKLVASDANLWPPMDRSCFVDWRRFGLEFNWHPRHLPITDEADIYYAGWKARQGL